MARFRHEWIMVRQKRPRVHVFADSKMPRANMQEEEKARLCSLFFRPWSLCADLAAVPHVPHLLQLPLYPEPIVRRRKREKGKPAQEESRPSWTSSWARFIRGNIPSEHAARIIKRFLSLMVPRAGGNTRNSDDEAESETGDMEGHGAEQVKLNLDDAHKILRDDDKRLRTTHGVRARWSTSCEIMQEEGTWDTSGNNPTAQSEEYKKAANTVKKAHADKALRSTLLRTYPFMRVSACDNVHVGIIGRVLVVVSIPKNAKQNKTHQQKHKAVRQANTAVGFKRHAAASIYSHQGGIVSIRKWLDALQAPFFKRDTDH